eukprot:TRINITY_DN59070_c0_g1_i1.p2 TRINITY_DN59070_c0_g1~~TRINITY_DN59070_c0_g1_i1.p2  ORF type:complete len:104 (-),score=5.80 TRINITY_DN59070_c0_g1_i1:5-316(-)
MVRDEGWGAEYPERGVGVRAAGCRCRLTCTTGTSHPAIPQMLPPYSALILSLIHISEPTRLLSISYAVFCLKKKKHAPHITSYHLLSPPSRLALHPPYCSCLP